MKRFIYIILSFLIVAAVALLYLLNITSIDLKEMIMIPVLKTFLNVSLYLFFILMFLRLRDVLIKHTFKIEEIKENLGLAIYYSFSFFSVAIGIGLIIAFS